MSQEMFRVWCENKKEWESDPWLITPHGQLIESRGIVVRSLSSETHILERNTFFLDSCFKDIFEGDIVEGKINFEGSQLPHRGAVGYSHKFGSFCTKNEGGETLFHNIYSVKIIGNIHEGVNGIVTSVEKCIGCGQEFTDYRNYKEERDPHPVCGGCAETMA